MTHQLQKQLSKTRRQLNRASSFDEKRALNNQLYRINQEIKNLKKPKKYRKKKIFFEKI